MEHFRDVVANKTVERADPPKLPVSQDKLEHVESFEKAFEVKHLSIRANTYVGTAYLTSLKSQIAPMISNTAEENHCRARELNSEDLDLNYDLGLIYVNQQKYHEADAGFKKVTRIDPSYLEARNQLLTSLQNTGEAKEVLKHANQSAELKSGSNPECHASSLIEIQAKGSSKLIENIENLSEAGAARQNDLESSLDLTPISKCKNHSIHEKVQEEKVQNKVDKHLLDVMKLPAETIDSFSSNQEVGKFPQTIQSPTQSSIQEDETVSDQQVADTNNIAQQSNQEGSGIGTSLGNIHKLMMAFGSLSSSMSLSQGGAANNNINGGQSGHHDVNNDDKDWKNDITSNYNHSTVDLLTVPQANQNGISLQDTPVGQVEPDLEDRDD